jgi:hypothetical protein
MQKHEFSRGPDTGKLELLKLIKLLKENGYEFLGVSAAQNFNGYSEVTFHRDISYSTKEGDWINDNHIKISIEYSDNFDHENTDKYITNDENIFNARQSCEFIQELIDTNDEINTDDDTVDVYNDINTDINTDDDVIQEPLINIKGTSPVFGPMFFKTEKMYQNYLASINNEKTEKMYQNYLASINNEKTEQKFEKHLPVMVVKQSIDDVDEFDIKYKDDDW